MIVAMKLQPDDGPRSILGISPGSDDAVGSRRSSLGDSPKGSGSTLGRRREITGRRPEDSLYECRRLLDWWELEGWFRITVDDSNEFGGFGDRYLGLEGWLRVAVLVQQDMPKGNAAGFFVKE
ncbi:hypothetical protein B296_00000268 [Ensete ventricosum]|uniref:Uncharacterized protein n=1 Tax=Ensete ventricosum TaxID=4639 RepID=A0A427ARU1_ENSVE|nr:hypothetical protein B296_00000268 [Ensete ventricosum]